MRFVEGEPAELTSSFFMDLHLQPAAGARNVSGALARLGERAEWRPACIA